MPTTQSTPTEDATGRPITERCVRLGKYRIMAKLGTGGMADVFLAVAEGAMNVNRLVVVKRLRDEQASDAGAREMFLNEARLAARLNHANVIQTFEAGSEAGSWFLAMEYVEGQPFSRVLTKLRADGKRIEARLAARIAADTLAGLHYAHELADFDGTPLGIVHRDVSPQNIMITYAGVTKIVDFGIAKAVGTQQTAHGVFKGKVAYMAPEQVVGESVDGRADVFAAGIVLWEALTGRHLMAAETPAKTLYNLMNKPIPRAAEVQPDVPAGLDEILVKALERDLDQRWASADAMRDALEHWLTSAGGVRTEEVGKLVSTLFEDRKRTVQQQVKTHLAALSLGRTSEPSVHERSGAHLRAGAETIIDLSEGATPGSQASMYRVVTTGGGIAPATAVVPAPSKARRVALVTWISVSALALLVNAAALWRSRSSPEPAPEAKVFVSTTSAAQPAPPAPTLTTEATTTATTAAPTSPATGLVRAAADGPSRPTPVRWSPPAAPAPAAAKATAPPATASAEPHVAPPAAAATPTVAKPAETTTGRTFRRSL